MKIRKILFSVLSVLACVSTAHATPSSNSVLKPMYVGVQGGYADTNFGLSTVISTTGEPMSSADIGNHVIGVRAYGGYLWNEYVGTEAGYLRVRSTRYTNINQGDLPTGDITEYAVDGRIKLFLPMAAYIHLSPYFQGGIAYVNATSHGGIVNNASSDFGYSWHPEFGLGIGYNFTNYLTGDISWTTISKRNSNVPPIYLLFLGLTYHFALEDSKSIPNIGDNVNDDY